jgi:predicted transcriptional regulator/archaellum component FlaG (FlaF/FlaG flagellin family)
MMMVFEPPEKNSSREKMEIMADILHYCKDNKKKSHVMQKANLNFDRVNYYLDHLLHRGLLELIVSKDSKVYRTTGKGREFLERYCDMMQLFSNCVNKKQDKNNDEELNLDQVYQIICKPRIKILAISFLLAVSLSMITSSSLLPTLTTTTLIYPQQLVYAQEDTSKDKSEEVGGQEQVGEDFTATIEEEGEKGEEDEVKEGKEDVGHSEELPSINEEVGYDNSNLKNDIVDTDNGTASQVPTKEQVEVKTGEADTPDELVVVSVLQKNSSMKQSQSTERQLPDDNCLFDPSLPRCAPIDGECPPGFLTNEDGNCFPDKPCPKGYTKLDDDETGACYPVEDDTGFKKNPDCWSYAKFICNDKGECDSDKYDCWSTCADGTERPTGQCPGDDDFCKANGFCRDMSSSQKGLKVIVDVKGADGPGEISVKSETTGKTLSKTVDNIKGKHTFHFKADVVPVGGTFEACAESNKLDKKLCTKGKNGPEKEPEEVTIKFEPQPPNSQILKLSTNKKTYKLGEEVTFIIKNTGDQTLEFPDGKFGLQIKNLDNGENCNRISTQALTELKPGESKKQIWDQKCSDGKQVKPGKYNARIASGSVSASTAFSIKESPPSARGLKVIVDVKGADGPGEISVKSETTGKTLSKTVDNIKGKHKFNFNKGDVPVGGEFKVCAHSFEKASDKPSEVFTMKESCIKGVNGPEKEPEEVTITFLGYKK